MVPPPPPCTISTRSAGTASSRLCVTIAREVLGQTVESFLDSGDGGRDVAFAGTWNPTGQDGCASRH